MTTPRDTRRGPLGLVTSAVFLVVTLVAYVPVVIAHVLRRLSAPLHRRRRGTSSWSHRRAPGDGRAAAAKPFEPSPPERRAIRTMALITAAAVTITGITIVSAQRSSPGSDDGSTPERSTFSEEFEHSEAFADAPWAEMLRLNFQQYWGLLQFDVSGGWRVADLSSEYVNVTDGERTTIAPPDDGSSPPFEIWLLGGSGAFGAGQRDDHTIASELVRLGAADGRSLRVRNFAVPATVNWQTTLELADLLSWRPAPDLVVVYDGDNDVTLQAQLNGTEAGTTDRPASLLDQEFATMLAQRAKGDTAARVGLDRAPPSTVARTTDPDVLAQRVADRYRHGVELARELTTDVGVPIAFYWQPNLFTKTPPSDADRRVMAQFAISDADAEGARTIHDRVLERLRPDGVVDLGDVMDATSEPIYWDQVHTNETGAKLAAEAMYQDLLDRLPAAS